MSKPARLTAYHRATEYDVFQVTVEMPAPFVNSLDEAADVAVRGVKQMQADAIEQGFLDLAGDQAEEVSGD